jgi:hypothetical protein
MEKDLARTMHINEAEQRRAEADGTVLAPVPEEIISDEVMAAIEGRVKSYVRSAADDFYERVLEGVQEYLSDNARFNISQRLTSAEKQVAFYRARWWRVMEALRAANDALKHPDRPEWRANALRKVELALNVAGHRLDDGEAAKREPSSTPDADEVHRLPNNQPPNKAP